MRPTLSLVLLGILGWPGDAAAQDRRNRASPGIVLETGARMGNCDALSFTPDGKQLLAVGDDKVVRVWDVAARSLSETTKALRWPIYRDQTGAIYAMALSPKGGSRVAIGGHGLITGLVVVLDRKTGKMLHSMDTAKQTPLPGGPTVALAWSPDGNFTVHGSTHGQVYRWEPAKGGGATGYADNAKPASGRRIRLLAFLDDERFLVATQDGKVSLRTLNGLKTQPKELLSFDGSQIYRAELSPDRRWLALARIGGGESGVDLIDVNRLLVEGDAAGVRRTLTLPRAVGLVRYPTALAFAEDSQTLAVGTQQATERAGEQYRFNRITGGNVFAFSLPGGETLKVELPIGHQAYAVAFRPGTRQVAVSGGPNHETRLFDLGAGPKPLSESRAPGSTVWSVALSVDGHHLAWREGMNPDPTGPNRRGAGPWRYFPLVLGKGEQRAITKDKPKDFEAVAPLEKVGDWSVRPTADRYLWEVVGPGDKVYRLDNASGLYDKFANQIPMCYTFLPARDGKPPRLAVGHMWGVTLYDLTDAGVKLARVMMGHQGEVVAVAPSRNGELLVSASRDQTIACWSLVDWDDVSPELGARFTVQDGRLRVQKVHPGSPAWEAGLTDGDAIDLYSITAPAATVATIYNPAGLLKPHPQAASVYVGQLKQDGEPIAFGAQVGGWMKTAQAAADELHKAKPGREHVFAWGYDKGKPQAEKTTIRQRPLWVFYPTRGDARGHGGDWLLWRWRDYFYDSNAKHTDRLAGFQVSPNARTTPEFHPLSKLTATYHNPNKVWSKISEAIQGGVEAKKVAFADVEPPKVEMTVTQSPNDATGAPRNLVVEVTVTPTRDVVDGKPAGVPKSRSVKRLSLWIDDYLYDAGDKPLAPDPVTGVVRRVFQIRPASLQVGENRVRAVAFNDAGGVGEDARTELLLDARKERGKPKLLALCVGIGTYPKAAGVSPLPCAKADAEKLAEVFVQHRGSKVFDTADVRRLRNEEATRAAILAELKKMASLAQPGDWLVLFLSGHGGCVKDEDDVVVPGSYYFVCHDTKAGVAKTGVRSADIVEILKSAKCNKLILMDACHSGDAVDDDIVRSMNRDGAEFLMFIACERSQSAIELNAPFVQQAILDTNNAERKKKLQALDTNHGLFTRGLLVALDPPEGFDKRVGRRYPIAAETIQRTIRESVRDTLDTLQVSAQQTPVFSPQEPEKLKRLKVFCTRTERKP